MRLRIIEEITETRARKGAIDPYKGRFTLQRRHWFFWWKDIESFNWGEPEGWHTRSHAMMLAQNRMANIINPYVVVMDTDWGKEAIEQSLMAPALEGALSEPVEIDEPPEGAESELPKLTYADEEVEEYRPQIVQFIDPNKLSRTNLVEASNRLVHTLNEAREAQNLETLKERLGIPRSKP